MMKNNWYSYKTNLSFALLFTLSTSLWADSDQIRSSGMLVGDILVAVSAFVGLGAVIYLFHLGFTVLEIQKRKLYIKKGIPLPQPKVRTNVWTRLYKRATNRVPMNQEADIMLDHNYDGIQELDNSLPPWWVAMFYLTIAIGTAYFAYYHYYDLGLSSSESYALEMERAERMKLRFLEKQANAIDETKVIALEDKASLGQGLAIYKSTCAACHGQQGEGGVGPNLTDEYWLHGADIKSVFATIKYGVPEKGMIAWKSQLRPVDIHKVASYIMTLQGTNPPNPKEAQGVKVKASSLNKHSLPQDSLPNSLSLKE